MYNELKISKKQDMRVCARDNSIAPFGRFFRTDQHAMRTERAIASHELFKLEAPK